MSDRARNYVKRLDNEAIPSAVKSFLFFVADYHQINNGCAWPGVMTLADDMGLTTRQIRRLLKQAVNLDLISYHPGLGSGNVGKFIFKHLIGDQGVSFLPPNEDAKGDICDTFLPLKEDPKEDIKGDTKGDICDIVIRMNHEPITLNQNQDLHSSKNDEGNHHAQKARGLTIWLTVKQELKTSLPEVDWNLWVRPMYCLKELDHNFLLLAVPANKRIMEGAERGKKLIREKLQEYGYTTSITRYPNDYELEELCRLNPEWNEVRDRLMKNKKPPVNATA